MEQGNSTTEVVTRECALCGFTTVDVIVVCPNDGSALVTHKPDPFLGKTLAGRFDISALIGSGGMGNVYKATQRVVERLVAVKILHSEKLQQREAVLRFQQEARAAATLSHPNIVGFFDFGLTEDNIPFIVMDYIEGTSLFETFKETTLPLDRFITVFTQVCDALQHAHDHGIVHRDIKPSNIMLCKDAEGKELVKILDFGIAKLLPRKDTPDRASLTQTGELFGSPQYMSPEQFAGQALDARSDMYSLGCVMYEALVGRPPVNAESIIELVQQHAHEKPAPLRSVKDDLEVPHQLEAVIFKTLEKDPDLRFPSMSALKHNLEFVPRFAEAERNQPAQSQAKAALDRTSKLAIVTALLVVAVAGAAIGTLLFAVNPPGDHSLSNAFIRAQLNWTDAFAPNNKERALSLCERLRDIYAKDGNLLEASRMATRCIDLSKQMNLQDWRAADDLIHLAQIQEQNHSASAHHTFSDAQTLLRQLAQANRDRQRWVDNLAADRPIDATIINIERNVGGESSAALAVNLADYGDDLLRARMPEQAEPVYQQLIAMKEQLSREQQTQLADSLKKLGDDLSGKEQAENYYKTAVELRTKTDGAQSQAIAEIERALGLFYKNHGQITEAESTLMDALAIAQAAQGEHAQLTLSLYNDLGEVYREEKEFDKATEMFKLADRLKVPQ